MAIKLVWYQTKIARQEVQSPLYYSHFGIAEFSQYQYLFDLVAGLLKNGNRKALSSHVQTVRFKTEMTRF